VELSHSRLTLDRAPLDAPAALTAQLGGRHRGLRSAGTLAVACTADTPASRVFEALKAAGAAGFHHPVFVFQRREAAVRPLLGTFRRIHTTGARMT
jgi:hypothetical protein